MRLKCSMALCYVMLLAVSVYSLHRNANSPLQKLGQAEAVFGSQQWVSANDIENVPYVPIKEVARRQWCKERRLSSQATVVSVSTRDAQSPVGRWCETDWTESLPQALRSFGRTLVLPPQ